MEFFDCVPGVSYEVFVFWVVEVLFDEFYCFGVGGVAGAEVLFVF